MTVAAILFDVDGTLLDTRTFILAAFEHAFASAGIEVPAVPALAHHIGRPLDQIYRDLAGPALAPDLVEQHRSFQEAHLDLALPFPGVGSVLERLATSGLILAAVTSRSRRTSHDSLERAGILTRFAAVVSAEDAPALKPDPAPLLLALDRAGATGRPAAMVGDTVHDVRAGQAIGALTVAALYGIGPDEALAAAPDYTINDISELPAVLGV